MRGRFLHLVAGSGIAALASVGLISAYSGTPAVPQTVSNGNVTTCAEVGFGSDTQVAGSGDSNVGISVSGSSITVTILGSGVVIDAVVVKGGPNANIYSPAGAGTFTTPTNPNNGQPYGLSHYFACYHIEEVTTTTTPTITPTTQPGGQTVQPQVQGGTTPRPQAAPAPRGVQVQPRLTG